MGEFEENRAISGSFASFCKGILPALLLAAVAVIPAGAGDAPGEESNDEPATTAIEGRVVDPEGNGIAGATVLGLSVEAKPVQKPGGPFAVAGNERREHAVAEAVTGEDGTFRIDVEGAAPFMLRADAEGFAPGRLAKVGAGDKPTIRLSTGWTVRGQVFDMATGKRIAGTEVKARGTITDGFGDEEHRDDFVKETVSDEQGRFVLTDLEPNYYRVVAVADGYSEGVVSRLEVGLQGGQPDPVYLYLAHGVTITGKVTEKDGSPIEKAGVRVRPEAKIPADLRRWARSGGFSAKTDEHGAFTIKGIPPAPSYVLEVDHDDYAPAAVTGVRVREGMTSSPVEVVLDPGTSLKATLLADGQPYAGDVSLSLTYTLPASKHAPVVSRSGKEVDLQSGKLTAGRLPTGTARVVIGAPGYDPVVREKVTLAVGQPVDLGEIVFESGPRITGRVLDGKGKPLANASVEAMSFSAGMSRKQGKTGNDGTFKLGGLQDAPYTVSAEAEGYGRGSLKDVKPGGDPVELSLQPAAKIRGRVIAGDPPQPVGGFTIESRPTESNLPFQLEMVGMSESRMDFRDPGGEFVIGGLSGGSYKLKVEATGFVAHRIDKVEVTAGETVDLGDVVLDRGATLYGTVREKEGGRPLGGAVVELEQPGMFNMRNFAEMGSAARTTGPDGSFSISGLAPGKHSIRVEHEKYATRKVDVEIAAGIAPSDLTVELGSGGIIEGTFRDKDGRLVSGGMVVAMQGFVPQPDLIGTTDDYGHFRIENLAPGSYRVMAMVGPGTGGDNQAQMMASMQMQSVEVTEGETSIVNIPPQSGAITVSGTVRQGAERVEARLIWVRMAADGATPEDFAMTVSDPSGAFQVRLSGAGEYRVGIQPTGDRNDPSRPGISVKVDIPEEEQVTQDLVIPDAVLSGTVLDASTGERLSKVRVAAVEHREEMPLREAALATAAETDEDGRYRLEGLGNRTYRLLFSKDGYAAQALEPIDLEDAGTEEGVDVSLEPASPVRVRVSDRDGNPVEGVFVTALDFPALMVAGTTAKTDMDGEAILEGLADGAYDLAIVATGWAPTVERDVLVPAEGTVRIEATSGDPLTVRVIDTQKRPVARASIRIREENGPDLTSMLTFTAVMEGKGLVTGPDGTARISNLEPGRYEIEARWQGIVVEEKTTVQAGKHNEVEVKLRGEL